MKKTQAKKPWEKDLDSLTPKQLRRYDASLEVLRMMRKGETFSKASKTAGVSPRTAKRFLGNTLQKRKNRLHAKKDDSLLRKLWIIENGREEWIQVRGIKKARTVAKYHSAIGQATSQGTTNSLEKFAKKKIKDNKGKTHSFEVDVDKIKEQLEKIEEPEEYTIYTRGD